jgi:AcrR family transcriptional regulator
MKRARLTAGERLRTAILAAADKEGRSLYEIANTAGLGYSTVYRFVIYKKDIYLDTADLLAGAVGIKLLA